jgi:hypothetical protein
MESRSTKDKALEINLDRMRHGTFAEIGAGQEVAGWFFRVGGAAGTVAKTMSAYDMKFSDAVYGPAQRYVSRERLLSMLDHEYGLLIERLDATRGETTTFFAFADTVAARSHSRRDRAHGWLGIRFQHEPRATPSQLVLHANLFDTENIWHKQSSDRMKNFLIRILIKSFRFENINDCGKGVFLQHQCTQHGFLEVNGLRREFAELLLH